MTLRRRLTVSYAVILTACLLVMGAAAYYEFVIEFEHFHKHPDFSMTTEVMEVVLGVGLPAVLLGIVGGWWLVRRSLRPISELTTAAEGLDEGNLLQRLPRSFNGDEIDRLSEVLNELTARLDSSMGQMREFTLHASHELKTPLTIMRGEIESALRDGFSRTDPRALCVSQLEEIRRLSRIVEGLTLLAKADAKALRLDCAPVPLHDLVREGAEDAETLADSRCAVHLQQCDTCVVSGDRDRLRQLLLNLTDNALKYSEPHGAVTLALASQGGRAVLTVSNTGRGLTEEQCAKAFDRFYRGEHARGSAIEGVGLGLSLCRWIAEAHGGSISLASQPGELTTATVSLPLAG